MFDFIMDSLLAAALLGFGYVAGGKQMKTECLERFAGMLHQAKLTQEYKLQRRVEALQEEDEDDA